MPSNPGIWAPSTHDVLFRIRHPGFPSRISIITPYLEINDFCYFFWMRFPIVFLMKLKMVIKI